MKVLGTWVLLMVFPGAAEDINGFQTLQDCRKSYTIMFGDVPPIQAPRSFCINTEDGSVVRLNTSASIWHQ